MQGFYRTATRDYTVGENTIPAGARVLLLFAAANRDPRHYDDPDTFDLDRNPTDHLAFGGGVHFCLGVPLTRLEGARVFSQLLPRVEAIRLAGELPLPRQPDDARAGASSAGVDPRQRV